MLQPITGLRTVNESPAVEGLIRDLLYAVGEEPEREGLLDTPKRVRKSLAFLTQGYEMEPRDVLGTAIFEEDYDAMVVVKDIEFYSLCEHHMLPFFGKAHIAYVPNGRIVGLSKLPRLVEVFSRRLQVQERLTKQVADWLQEHLSPKGVGVVLEAEHLCMSLRGVQKLGAKTVTSALRGLVREDARTRQEFLSLTSRSAGEQ